MINHKLGTTTAAPAAPAPVPPTGAQSRALDRRGLPPDLERQRLRNGLGAALREARSDAGLSQARLASLAGCNRRSVERLENGSRRPTTAMLHALALTLVTPPSWPVWPIPVAAMYERLAGLAGHSLVESTDRGQRQRARRLRKARAAAPSSGTTEPTSGGGS